VKSLKNPKPLRDSHHIAIVNIQLISTSHSETEGTTGTKGIYMRRAIEAASACAGAIAVILLFTTGALAAGNIGKIFEIEKAAFGTPPGGTAVSKKLDDGVVLNEFIETVPQGALQISLIDSTTLSMGGESKLIMDELVFDPNTGKGSSIIKFAGGTFYWVTGQIATKDLIAIDTPVATIGVRGTEFSLKIGPDGATEVAVVDGLVDLKSKTTGEVITIPAGHNSSVNAAGRVLPLQTGIPRTGDRAIDTVVAKAEARVIEAAAKGNGKVLPVKASLRKTAANDNGKGAEKGFKLDKSGNMGKGSEVARAADRLRGGNLLDPANGVNPGNGNNKLGEVSRRASSNGNGNGNGNGNSRSCNSNGKGKGSPNC
jgi:hypothetical protein